MKYFLLLSLHMVVGIKCSNLNSEYYDLDEFSEELSGSDTGEVTEQQSTTKQVTEANSNETANTGANTGANTTEITKITEVTTWPNMAPCSHPGKSEEDKSSMTLINYPFSVSIQRKGAHYASGALLNKKWIITSGEEFYNIRESIKLFRARLGSVDCKKGGTVVPLKRVEIHPSYVPGVPNFDLGLLRVAEQLEYTEFIRPISLSKIRTKVISAKFMTTYWPRILIHGEPIPADAKERVKPNSMRVSTQRLIPHDKCLVLLNDLDTDNSTLHESTLCLKPFSTLHSICMPDAGAPVVAEDGLWGITSGWTTNDCLKQPSPTLFTRVSSLIVKAWLDSVIAARV